MSFILLVEQTAPETPSTAQVVLYPKSDGIMYSKDDAGLERAIALFSGIATQAEQETGTSLTAGVVSGRQHFHPGSAKAWVNFNSAGTIAASYNITSITDTGIGNWTVNIATDFSGASYTATLFGGRNATANLVSYNLAAMAAGTLQINCWVNAGATDPDTADIICVSFFGDQA